jgi:YHS domain-containing protein
MPTVIAVSSRSRKQPHRAVQAAGHRRRSSNAAVGGIAVVALPAGPYSVSLRAASRRRSAIAYGGDLPRRPVGGMPVNLAVSLGVADGTIHFCCPHCIEKHEADPPAYVEAVKAQRRRFAQRTKGPVRCPANGQRLAGTRATGSNEAGISFCRETCREAYQADPARYAGDLAAAYAYQTKCPVSGQRIAPAVSPSVRYSANVYFCSDRCRRMFEDDPARCWDPPAEQGPRIHIE